MTRAGLHPASTTALTAVAGSVSAPGRLTTLSVPGAGMGPAVF